MKYWVVLLVLLLFCIPVSVSAADITVDPVVSAGVKKNEIVISVSASFDDAFVNKHAGSVLYLFSIRPYQSTTALSDYTPLSTAAVGKDVSLSVTAGQDSDLLYCKYLFALKNSSGGYEIVTSARYVNNPEAAAELTYDYPAKLSKKGLQVHMLSDAQLLGVAHTTVNVEAGDFIIGYTKPAGNVPVISHTVAGKTVYFYANKVAALDKRIKELTDAGIHVFLQIINTPYNSDKMSQEVSSLYFVGASSGASMYAFNTKDKDSVLYLTALFELLAERYTREDKLYGFAGSYIIGYDVNSNRLYNNAGPMDMTSYIYNYTALVRIADTALRSKYANGRIYIPISNRWSVKEGDDQFLDYPAHSFISTINTIIKQGGDIPWNLSVSAYASSISGISAVWNDPEALNTSDTPYITMKNINVACDFMNGQTMLYNGKSRDIIIGEFGINADPGIQNELANQAASYAFAYYKAAASSQISAIIYHRHVDSAAEQNMYFGLWENRPDTVVTPLSQKPIYDVFKYIDITPPSEMASSVLGMIGADIWTSVSPGVGDSETYPRLVIYAQALAAADVPDKKFSIAYEFKSKGEIAGFAAGENAFDIYSLGVSKPEAEKILTLLEKKIPKKTDPYIDILEVPLDNSLFMDYMGTYKKIDSNLFNGAKTGYLKITGKAELTGSDSEYVTVMLRLNYTIPSGTVNPAKETMNRTDGQEIIYEGTAKIKANEWDNITFDVSEFLALSGGKADSMRIWILPEDSEASEAGSCTLMLAGVSVLAAGGLPIVLKIIITILIIALSAIVLFAIFIGVLIIRNKIKKAKRKKAYLARRAKMTRTRR